MGAKKPDFSGWATKANLPCTDGRTILNDAFKHQDGMIVPLVYQHGSDKIENILGHAELVQRDGSTYMYGYFNDTPAGQHAKTAVKHGDLNFLSIWANKLVERSKQVAHGMIREVSLVLAGANPGAVIDNLELAHGDTITRLDDEAVIFTGLALEHEDKPDPQETVIEHADDEGETVADVVNTMSEKQKNAMYFVVGEALDKAAAANSAEHADGTPTEDILEHQEGTQMTNVFEQNAGSGVLAHAQRPTLTREQIKTIVDDADRLGSLSASFLAHAQDYGINDIDLLFPDARAIANSPEFVSRRMEWVSAVLGGTKHSPFSRIKSLSADITFETARARGYIKGSLKKNEFFGLSRRITTPKTIYKKQKLDRDDIIDITDLDIVAWIKAEMRVMLDEELARAVLLGDGREPDDDDKINEDNIRPIAFDDDFYTHKVTVANNIVGEALVEAVLRNRQYYRGESNPSMFTTETIIADMLLARDTTGRRYYNSVAELAQALRVKEIIPVAVMEGAVTDTGDLLMVLVNLSDYTIGADRGGAVTMFEDFDIDYNQEKYLLETRVSGALTKYKTAMTFSRTKNPAATLVTPQVPTFVPATGVITIPSQTGVVYKNAATGAVLTAGAQSAIPAGSTYVVDADPSPNYQFPHNVDEDWAFTRPAS